MNRTPAFKPNARTIFDARYPRKDEDGNPAETPAETVERVGINVAMPNALYVPAPDVLPETTPNADGFPFATARRQYDWLRRREGLKPSEGIDLPTQLAVGWDTAMAQAERYMDDLLVPLHFLPNSPTWTGAGTPLGQLAACFVLPVADDLGQGPDSIMRVLHKATMIQQTGGGNGFSFGRLRPRNALVERSMGKASGPMGFARVYNGAFAEIAQGGSRRGANMLVMPVWHPDIREFIAAKITEGVLDQFNFSVAITDEFMEAVEKDGDFDLRFDGKVYETIKARDLWDEITQNAWVIGDPGNLFIDRANRDNPCPARYTLEATNPCVTGDTWVMNGRGPERMMHAAIDHEEYGGGEIILNGERHWVDRYIDSGVKPVYILTTKEGYTLRLTRDHRLMTPDGWVEAKRLSPGDKIVLNNHRGLEWEGRIDGRNFGWDQGYLTGAFIGDGTWSGKTWDRDAILNVWETDPGFEGVRDQIEKSAVVVADQEERPTRSDWRGWSGPYGNGWLRLSTKAVTFMLRSMAPEDGSPPTIKGLDYEQIETQASDFYQGFLRGLFDADGHVESGNGSPNVRLTNSDYELIEMVQRMLLRLGILSRIYRGKDVGTALLPDGKGGMAEYEVRQSWRLVISGASVGRYADIIGFSNERKMDAINGLIEKMTRGFYEEKFEATFESLTYDCDEEVYDVQVPGPHAFDANGFYAHNCGEQWLPPYSNCCLGSIAVSHFASWGDAANFGTFDWEGFKKTIILSAQFLDDVVDANRYVPEVPELEEAAMGERRIGLGLMGLADAMLKMGIRYGSPEGLSFASQVTEFARFWTMMTSIERAKERGPFEWIADSIYNPALIAQYGFGAEAIQGLDGKVHRLWERPKPLDGSYHDSYEFGMPEFHWDDVEHGIRNWGIRNACQFTFAPTGTISNVAGLEGSGCEPVFAIVYKRTMMQDEENVTLFYASDLFQEALKRHFAQHGMGLTEDRLQEIIDAVVANNGSCQGVDLIPESIQRVFVTAADVTGEEHVWMQASLQAWVDNSISKTINLPNEATVEDVANIYRLAYDLACKGITVYRQGSRSLEVLATTKDTEGNLTDWPAVTPLAIPDYASAEGLDAKVFPIETYHGKVQVTITHIKGYDDRPFDVRLQIGKGGNDLNANVEAIGRMISLSLRGGISVDAIVGQLEHIGGATSYGFGERKVRSVADGVAKLLKRLYMSEAVEAGEITNPVGSSTLTLAQGDVCPNCHQATVVIEAGCRHCETRLGGCGEFSGCD